MSTQLSKFTCFSSYFACYFVELYLLLHIRLLFILYIQVLFFIHRTTDDPYHQSCNITNILLNGAFDFSSYITISIAISPLIYFLCPILIFSFEFCVFFFGYRKRYAVVKSEFKATDVFNMVRVDKIAFMWL